MTKVNVIIPVADYEASLRYYTEIVGFEPKEGFLHIPGTDMSLTVKLMVLDDEARRLFPPKLGFPTFGYSIEANFLSYCMTLLKRGAKFTRVLSDPGGYYASLADLDGNQFEIECPSFDEIDPNVKPDDLPFFISYD